MNQLLMQWTFFALAFGVPPSSTTSELNVVPPTPCFSQCALIEAHDTARVGWWSSPALEIGPPGAPGNGT